ncbi:mammalian cell entry protein [Mycolicibacterium sp. F2034L]|uniref:mammalian cell entry protein n=1 Tax=Mycolicibacterium sp. F2034L TaxID=2926422 RepID=UPI001FF57FE8|nr:mammalian cell entry protein [Mycolicibacterium sp. F2034L]MCK0177083.1 mammalian cell entry protein [Mycolicibacterium sp. F2034L]
MEDQPADSGDLTTGSVDKPARTRRWAWRRANKVATPEVPRDEDSSAAEGDEPAEESATKVPTGKSRRTPKPVVEELEAESEASEPEPAQETESDPELTDPAPPPLLMPYRPAGKRLLIAATAASVLFVAAGAFAGATLQPYLADRAAVETKLDIARTATEAITTLWTYTPDDMAALPDRSSRFLTGDFATEYRRYIDAIVAANAQAQVSNTTEVTGAAVESLSADEASALVYTNSVSTSPVSKNIPSLQYRSYRLTMERDNADWRITSMVPVTNLDLTPQL